MSTVTFSQAEYQTILRSDFASFIERAFRELNPSTEYIPGQYIELLAAVSKFAFARTTRSVKIQISCTRIPVASSKPRTFKLTKTPCVPTPIVGKPLCTKVGLCGPQVFGTLFSMCTITPEPVAEMRSRPTRSPTRWSSLSNLGQPQISTTESFSGIPRSWKR
jgi:hypothetical protein